MLADQTHNIILKNISHFNQEKLLTNEDDKLKQKILK